MTEAVTTCDAARQLVDLITGTWRSQALYAAAALRLPDHVAAGRTDVASLAEASGASADGIGRLARLLAAFGVFKGDEEAGYRLSPAGELLRDGADGSLRDMCLLYGEESFQAWSSVVSAISTGAPGFDRAHGMPLQDYLASDPAAGRKFQRAMAAGTSFFADAARAFDFAGRRSVVDVGGGSGLLLTAVLRAHPHLRGTLFERPATAPIGVDWLAQELGDDPAAAVQEGNMFESVPPGADVYLLSRVLQDWDDDACARLLDRCRAAMADSARLLILERVIPADGSALLPLLYDLHLLVMTGGRERSLDGYAALLERSGLRLEAVRSLALETSLLVAAPRP
jgi:hypothetical protein